MSDVPICRDRLPAWVLAAVPPEDTVTAIQPRHYADGGDRVLVTGAPGAGRGEYSLRQPVPNSGASNAAVVTARIPAQLKDRLDRAGAANGGVSAVMRQLLERGLEDFEARDAATIKDPARREHFISGRLARKSKRK